MHRSRRQTHASTSADPCARFAAKDSGLPQRAATQSVTQSVTSSPTQSLAQSLAIPPRGRTLDRGVRERTWRWRASLARIAAAESSLARGSRERRTAGATPAARQASVCERISRQETMAVQSPFPAVPIQRRIQKSVVPQRWLTRSMRRVLRRRLLIKELSDAPNRMAKNARFPVLGRDAISVRCIGRGL